MSTCNRCGGILPHFSTPDSQLRMCDCEGPSADKTSELPNSEGAFPVSTGSDLFDWYEANNDYQREGSTPDEALSECDFELRTCTPAFLFLRHDLTKQEALAQVDNLRWLVEQAYGPNWAEVSESAKDKEQIK